MAIIQATAEPETKTSGNWAFSALNTSPTTWHLIVTITNASTNAQHTGNAFYAILAANDNGGLWLQSKKASIYDAVSGAVMGESGTLAWTAGAQLGITVTLAAGTNASSITTTNVSGVTSGTGTVQFTRGSNNPFANGTLGIGIYGGGGFTFPGSLSDVDNTITGYTISADTVAVGITGTAAGLYEGHKISADTVAVDVTGTAAGLLYSRKISADAVSVDITGTAATLTFDSSDPYMLASAGIVDITGTAAGLLITRMLAAGAVSVDITGTAAGLAYGHPMAASSGTVDITGTSAGLTTARKISAATAAVDITGTNATLTQGTVQVGAHGIYQVNYGHAPTSGSITLQTKVAGSSFLLVMGGNMNDIGDGPSDSEGNPWRPIGTSWQYVDAANSPWGVSAWRAINGVGDATSHVFTQGITLFDEMTMFAVELERAHYLVAVDRQEEANAGTPGTVGPQCSIVIPSSVGPCIITAEWWGSGPVGSNHTASPDGSGWVQQEFYGTNHNDGYVQGGIWAKIVTAGTHTVQFTHSPAQGSKARLMAFAAMPTLAAEPGSADVTGTSASLKVGYKIAADSAAVSITGTSASFNKGYVVAADNGALTISGTDANLQWGHQLEADTAGLDILGTAASLVHDHPLQADSAAISIDGTIAALRHGHLVFADPGSVPVTGTEGALAHGRLVAADTTALPISGTDVGLLITRKVTADPGSVDIAGTGAALHLGPTVVADSGAVPITGTSLTLLHSHVLPAGPVVVDVTGGAAGLLLGRRIAADTAAVPVAGTDAELDVDTETTLDMDPGAVPITTTDAGLLYGHRAFVDPGVLPIDGTLAALRRGWLVGADPVAVDVMGTNVDFLWARRMPAASTTWPILGSNATLTWSGLFDPPPTWARLPSRGSGLALTTRHEGATATVSSYDGSSLEKKP